MHSVKVQCFIQWNNLGLTSTAVLIFSIVSKDLSCTKLQETPEGQVHIQATYIIKILYTIMTWLSLSSKQVNYTRARVCVCVT